MQPIFLAIMGAMAALCLWAASRPSKGGAPKLDEDAAEPEQGNDKENNKQCTK